MYKLKLQDKEKSTQIIDYENESMILSNYDPALSRVCEGEKPWQRSEMFTVGFPGSISNSSSLCETVSWSILTWENSLTVFYIQK